MNWSDLPTNPSRRVLRQFAGAWLVFFLAWAAHQTWAKARPQWGLALAVLAVVVGLPGLAKPAAVRWLFVGWMRLAFPIGWLISQTALVVLFYGLLTPVALFFRLIGRDALGRKCSATQESYWTAKKTSQDLRRYFRQY